MKLSLNVPLLRV